VTTHVQRHSDDGPGYVVDLSSCRTIDDILHSHQPIHTSSSSPSSSSSSTDCVDVALKWYALPGFAGSLDAMCHLRCHFIPSHLIPS
jgi:hypothetical protein